MHRGSAALGEFVTLAVWCRDSVSTPTLPAAAPLATIYSAAGATVAAFKMPIMDRYHATGYFAFRLYVGADFAVGSYRVLYSYLLGSDYYADEDTFDVVADGHADGGGLSMHFYRRPTSDWIIYQGHSRVLRRRNPSLA